MTSPPRRTRLERTRPIARRATTLALLLTGLSAGRVVEAQTSPLAAVPAASATPPAGSLPAAPAPVDAAGSLERVRASYEYGDIDDVVEWSRAVTEGRLAATPAQRVVALRYLGIGLYLTGRTPGAEAAFFEMLRMRPDSTLDPRTTRPDIVAFFERVRAGHAQEITDTSRANNHKAFIWNFVPPVGQFQNGHLARGLLIGGLEVATLATAITSYALLSRWEQPHHVFPNYSEARTMQIVNIASVALFGAVYFFGVLDGIGHYRDLPDDGAADRPGRLALTPSGLALTF
ncbi:MAG TPA: hypothetical protein VGP07_19035 [Polyangia bacterium]|jgi:hypothetical protein